MVRSPEPEGFELTNKGKQICQTLCEAESLLSQGDALILTVTDSKMVVKKREGLNLSLGPLPKIKG